MDMDRQADEAWILGVQRKLYQWSQANPDGQGEAHAPHHFSRATTT
jgi:hypothetical protein